MKSRTRTTLGAAVATVSSATLGHSAIIYTDYSATPVTTSPGGSFIFVDFDTATASNVSSGHEVQLRFDSGYAEKPRLIASNNFSVMTDSGYAAKLASGNSIGGIFFDSDAFLEYSNIGAWNGTNGQGYLGVFNLVTGAHAWLDITYNDTANTLALNGLAINTNGPLDAGQTSAIPEPASAAALAALLAGGAAAFARRRHVSLAA